MATSFIYLSDHPVITLLAGLNSSAKSPAPGRHKYGSPAPRRVHAIMSADEVNAGKKSSWNELEITGEYPRPPSSAVLLSRAFHGFPGTICNLSPRLWHLQHLTSLYLNNNNLSRLPPDIAKLHNLVCLDISCNKLRSLPSTIGEMISLRQLLLNDNCIRLLPYELGKLFQLQTLGTS